MIFGAFFRVAMATVLVLIFVYYIYQMCTDRLRRSMRNRNEDIDASVRSRILRRPDGLGQSFEWQRFHEP